MFRDEPVSVRDHQSFLFKIRTEKALHCIGQNLAATAVQMDTTSVNLPAVQLSDLVQILVHNKMAEGVAIEVSQAMAPSEDVSKPRICAEPFLETIGRRSSFSVS